MTIQAYLESDAQSEENQPQVLIMEKLTNSFPMFYSVLLLQIIPKKARQ